MKRKYCISCGCKLEPDVVIVGNQYPSAVYLDETNINDNLENTSLNVTKCSNPHCGLVQLANEYDLQQVFDKYPYESGSTATMKQILQDVVDDSLKHVELNKNDVVLDIGGNDGSLLNFIKSPVKARVNIDAAADVKQVFTADNYKYIHSKFTSKIYNDLNLPKPKLIYSVAMFYHLTNPLEFCRNVYDIMDNDTTWILQMTYLGSMLKDNIFDNIVHEHAAYYSIKSLKYLLESFGLYIADAKMVKSYGGSIRVHIVKNKNLISKYTRNDYRDLIDFEVKNNINSLDTLCEFNNRLQSFKKSIKSIINHISSNCGTIWGFGASTKGNMLLQFLDINSDIIPYILDNSEKKIGLKTTGSLISIISEKDNLPNLLNNQYILILPYYYTDAFIDIIRKYLVDNQYIHLIIPLPYLHIITINKDGIYNANK